jgi:hypothetical protein
MQCMSHLRFELGAAAIAASPLPSGCTSAAHPAPQPVRVEGHVKDAIEETVRQTPRLINK